VFGRVQSIEEQQRLRRPIGPGVSAGDDESVRGGCDRGRGGVHHPGGKVQVLPGTALQLLTVRLSRGPVVADDRDAVRRAGDALQLSVSRRRVEDGWSAGGRDRGPRPRRSVVVEQDGLEGVRGEPGCLQRIRSGRGDGIQDDAGGQR
jgi:hypothetical protein